MQIKLFGSALKVSTTISIVVEKQINFYCWDNTKIHSALEYYIVLTNLKMQILLSLDKTASYTNICTTFWKVDYWI